jgi:serine protease AprX
MSLSMFARVIPATLLFSLMTCQFAVAAPYTPLVWQSRVDNHSNSALIGQRKHLTWVRDQNRNFIDDHLEATARLGAPLKVIVDLNRCLTPAEMERAVAPYGRITYVGKLITVVELDQVAPADLAKLAARPEVAMVEEQLLMNPEIDIASRAVAAHRSNVYTGTAEDLGLTGNGVVIAFVGTGITDANFTALAGKRVAGFDATDPNDPQDGSTNPPDTTTHESVMAAIAVGAGVPNETCRSPGGAAVPNCAGIASGARYVNVRQCHIVNGANTCDGFIKAADWVGVNARRFGIRVVSMAFSSCPDDDGTSSQAQQANFLVGLGLVVVASSSRNPANCMPAGSVGDRIVRAPGSAALALMVTATADRSTVTRADDSIWSNYTVGPRKDFTLMNLNRAALKPDLAAPAQAQPINPNGGGLDIYRSPTATHLTGVAGNSPATAIVAGAAALILERFPLMTAESVKQLLIESADSSRNTPFNTATGQWDSSLGWGMVNVAEALRIAVAQGTDLTFPTCATTGSTSGQPCALSNGQPSWNNSDITTATAPRVGVANTISVTVTNLGQTRGTATVSFGVIRFSAGNNTFHFIGSQQVTVDPGIPVVVSQPWTPTSTDHTCAQVSIVFAQDSDYTNNVTQRNLQVSASSYQMEVNNSLFTRAHYEVIAKSERRGWACRVDQTSFDLDPFTDCPRPVNISFQPPPNTPAGQQAQCQVGVYATPVNGERRLIGGVTVVTFVPQACAMQGQLVDVNGRPVPRARIELSPLEAEHAGPAVQAVSNTQGFFTINALPDVLQRFSVRGPKGLAGNLHLRPMCGPSLPRVVVGKQSLQLNYLPPVIVEHAERMIHTLAQ